MAQILWLFPDEIGVVSTKVTESAQLFVNRLLQVELFNDHTWFKVEVFNNNFLKVFISVSFSNSSISINVNRDRVSYTNTIGKLYECSLAEFVGNETLSNPSSSISSRSVDFSGIFSRESTTFKKLIKYYKREFYLRDHPSHHKYQQ